jgi:hypothetical protein
MPAAVPGDFNIGPFTTSRGERPIQRERITLKMTSTKVEMCLNRINRIRDLADLTEPLFSENPNPHLIPPIRQEFITALGESGKHHR